MDFGISDDEQKFLDKILITHLYSNDSSNEFELITNFLYKDNTYLDYRKNYNYIIYYICNFLLRKNTYTNSISLKLLLININKININNIETIFSSEIKIIFNIINILCYEILFLFDKKYYLKYNYKCTCVFKNVCSCNYKTYLYTYYYINRLFNLFNNNIVKTYIINIFFMNILNSNIKNDYIYDALYYNGIFNFKFDFIYRTVLNNKTNKLNFYTYEYTKLNIYDYYNNKKKEYSFLKNKNIFDLIKDDNLCQNNNIDLILKNYYRYDNRKIFILICLKRNFI